MIAYERYLVQRNFSKLLTLYYLFSVFIVCLFPLNCSSTPCEINISLNEFSSALFPAQVLGFNKLLHTNKLKLQGSFANSGGIDQIGGVLKEIFDPCGENPVSFSLRDDGKKWIALLHDEEMVEEDEGQKTGSCSNVLDRVKRLMMLGASAVIILVIKPHILSQLDISQLFLKPIVMITGQENISAIVEILKRKIPLHVDIKPDGTIINIHQKVSMWSTCGRTTPDSGVVCTGNGPAIKKWKPSSYWDYFPITSLLMMSLLLMRAVWINLPSFTRPQSTDPETELQNSARRVIQNIPVRRFQPRGVSTKAGCTCAVCLDEFQPKQRLRVLPCSHEFHLSCVDPWLISHHTCPLCKHNIFVNSGQY